MIPHLSTTLLQDSDKASSTAPRHAESSPGIDCQDGLGDTPGSGSRRQEYIGAREIARRERDLRQVVGPGRSSEFGGGEVGAAVFLRDR